MTRFTIVVLTLVLAFLALPVLAAKVVIPDGTKLCLEAREEISSATVQTGDHVTFYACEDVKAKGKTIIRKGAKADGFVLKARNNKMFGQTKHKLLSKIGRLGKGGELEISIDSIALANGEVLPLHVNLPVNGNNRYIHTAAVGAAGEIIDDPMVQLGASIGMASSKGKEAVIPVGARISLLGDDTGWYLR